MQVQQSPVVSSEAQQNPAVHAPGANRSVSYSSSHDIVNINSLILQRELQLNRIPSDDTATNGQIVEATEHEEEDRGQFDVHPLGKPDAAMNDVTTKGGGKLPDKEESKAECDPKKINPTSLLEVRKPRADRPKQTSSQPAADATYLRPFGDILPMRSIIQKPVKYE